MKYIVSVTRTDIFSGLDLEVEADSEDKAKEIALNQAGGESFSEHHSDYQVDQVADDSDRDAAVKRREAEIAADIEAMDLDLGFVRSQRDGMLVFSDWTQIGDAALGDHTAEEWATYRQELRDLPAAYSRVSDVVWPFDPPGQVIEDARLAALEE